MVVLMNWGTTMFGKTVTIFLGRSASVVLAVFGTLASAQAQDIDYGRMLDVAEKQVMVTQRMAAEVLLVTLDVNRELNLERLISSRGEFDRVLKGMRDGDSELRISAITDSALLAEIEDAEELWISMSAAVDNCISGNVMAAEHIDAVAEGSLALQDMFRDLADAFRTQSMAGESYSMLRVAIDTTRHARMLSQQMTKEFLLIAMGHQTGRNRYALRESAEAFENELQGLLEGDFDRLLLAAPTPEIRGQLHRIEEIWDGEYRPLIEFAVTEELLTDGAVAQMSRVNLRLLGEINGVAHLYNKL